jgi:hypothetical protein
MRPIFLSVLLCVAHSASAEPAATLSEPHLREGGEREHRLHLALDGDFTYGIGGQSTLGAQLHLTGYTAVWNTRHATGTIDVGLQFAYGNEPPALAPWLQGKDTDGAAHRIQALVTVGHTFHMGQRRRAAFGLHLFGGWNHWISSYSLRYPNENVSGSGTVVRDHFVTGAELKFSYRFSKHVGLNLVAGSPFPYQSSYVVGMFFVGAGLTFYLR